MSPAESLSTSAWRGLKADEKFRRYLEALGLPARGNPARIKHRLSREHPSAWKEFKEVAERRVYGDMSDDVYEIKNRNFAFSLLATISERSELHAKAFSAVEDISDPISSILDVGCENGFFTCLLALQWPNAKLTGMDPSEPALERARELASKLKLENITFTTGSAEEIGKVVGDERFDLITTVTVLHDGDLFPSIEHRHPRTSEIFEACAVNPVPPAFAGIAKAIEPKKGRWVAIERCQSPALFSIWCQTLDLVGLGVDWGESARLPCEDGLLTVLIAAHDRPRPVELRKAHGFWMSPEFNRWTLPGEPAWAIRDQQAEAIFVQLGPKTCIDRIVGVDANGVEMQRIEVWEAGALALFYMAIHLPAHTHLQLRAITDLPAMREHWKSTAAAMRKNAPPGARMDEFHLGA